MTNPKQLDLFAPQPDAEHSVRWQPADGDEPAFMPMFEAVRRLEGYGFENVEAQLRAGAQLRTPFAFYRLHESVISPSKAVARAMADDVDLAATPDPDAGPCEYCGGGLRHFPECPAVTQRGLSKAGAQ